jgi:hypothetical protein
MMYAMGFAWAYMFHEIGRIGRIVFRNAILDPNIEILAINE